MRIKREVLRGSLVHPSEKSHYCNLVLYTLYSRFQKEPAIHSHSHTITRGIEHII
jgi:hypothetical protein